MANEFYDAGEQRAARVQDLFARIAPRYDLINDLQSFGLHRYWKLRLLELARPKPAERALDLCCGTGDLALLLSSHGAQVLGVDFSERMLEVALRRSHKIQPFGQGPAKVSIAPQSAVRSPRFIQGDAMRVPVPDGSFDIVSMAYGLRNLADVKTGLTEMRRVARPGARLLVLDFGKPDLRLWRSFYFTYLKLFVPLLGRIFCGTSSAYAYILESLKHYPAQRGVAAQMRELGLINVRIINLLGGVMSINYAEKPR